MPKTSDARNAMQCHKRRVAKLRKIEIDSASFNYRDRKHILKRLGFSSYGAYLRSPMWRGISGEVLAKSNRCYCCNRKATEVHHREYTLESLTTVGPHLIPVCRSCHRKIEFKGETKRFKTEKEPKEFKATPKKPKSTILPLPTINRTIPAKGPTGLGRFVIERAKK